MKLNDRSINNLKGVHPALINVVHKAADLMEELPTYSFVITQGLRTLEEQKRLFAEKKSKTLKSKHLTGHAVDIAVFVNGKLTWDVKEYRKVTDIFKKSAEELNVEIDCGIDWKSFVDSPHIQIDPNKYKF